MALVACLVVVGGCTKTEIERLESAFEVRTVPACAPDDVSRLTVEPLGDFPTPAESIVSLATDSGPQLLGESRPFPLDTQLYRVSADTGLWQGMGIVSAQPSETPHLMLLLPLAQECLQLSSTSLIPPGAALALLPGGDVLVAGGQGVAGELALGRVKRLRVVEARLVTVEDGLFVKRSGATAVVGERYALIVGGGLTDAEGGVALQSYDRYDTESGRMAELGRLVQPRREHGAARLSDGSVLVVGGREQAGAEPLATMERIRAGEVKSEEVSLQLPRGVWSPTVQVRDDGRIAVVGKTEDGVAVSLIDLSAGEVLPGTPPTGEVATELGVSLPGGRLLFFELEGGRTTGAIWLLLPSLEFARLDDWLTDFSGLCRGRSLSLRDGRVLLTGARDADADCQGGTPEAFVIDVGRAVVDRRSVTRLPEHLFLRDDGSVVQLGASHMAVRREDRRSRFDNPGSVWLVEDNDAIALDRRDHWRWEGSSLIAERAQVRVELPGLRYRDVRFEVEASGVVELLLWEDGQQARSIGVSDTAGVGPALCTVEHEEGQRVHIERVGDQVQVRSGSAEVVCTLQGLDDAVAVALRARQQGSTIRFFSAQRL